MSRQRTQARRLAVQALYQWQMAGQDVADIMNHLLVEHDNGKNKTDVEYFRELVSAVPGNLTRLDEALQANISRPIEQVDPVERAILRLAAYELAEHPEIPYRVVINEAVELAKVFGAEQGHRFVNGVLDKTAQTLRPVETSAARR